MATPELAKELATEQVRFVESVERDLKSKLVWIVTVGTIAVWVAVFGGALYVLFTRGAAWNEQYIRLAKEVLLPFYQSTAAVVLAYVFGKPTARAIALRIGIR